MDKQAPFTAHWIGPAYDPREDLGIHTFGFEFILEDGDVPNALFARISADQRYTLRVNGRVIARGPQRGDAGHWFFETVDIAPSLRLGQNQILAEVTNFGWMAPMAQHSVRTAFLFEVDDPEFAFLNTPGDWLHRREVDRDFKMMSEGIGEYYIDVGPGEFFRAVPRGFERFDAYRAHAICRAELRGEVGGGSPWNLIPSTLPPQKNDDYVKPVRAFRRREGQELIVELAEAYNLSAGEELLLDFGEIVVGYPDFAVFDRKATIGEVRLTYCEALVDSAGVKRDRGATTGMLAKGYEDLISMEGELVCSASTSWLRTCRYVSVQSTADFEDFEFGFRRSSYPMAIDAEFECDDPEMQKLWDMCVRTLKLCAGETYYDCPYYEQLQYVGDTRLQALIGYYLSRDCRLQRNAIEQIHWSLMENGLTQSRYPSRQMQVIPPFSLWWVVMLYDAWMHDPEFDPARYVESAKGVIRAYESLLRDQTEPFWCFGDWLPEWKWGVPPGGPAAEMHLELLHLAKWTLGQLMGEPIEVAPLIEHPETEHGYALSRYRHWLAGLPLPPWDVSLVEGKPRCGLFWSYVKHVAMDVSDFGELLQPWRDMLELGLTTTPETGEPTRSDCHGWSAHPPLGLLQLVAGVTSAAPGWSSVRIRPKPGRWPRFSATIPHLKGDLVVRFADNGCSIECPVEYEFLSDIPSS